jgi:hypothetical protein
VSAAVPLSDLARAEFEARLEHARREVREAEARVDAAARKDFALAGVAGYWANVAWWSFRLGRDVDGRDALNQAVGWYVRRLEFLTAHGPPFRMRASDWMLVFEEALMASDPVHEQRLLEFDLPLGDRTLTELGEGYTQALRAFASGDAERGRAAAERMKAVPDLRAIKAQDYPHLGAVAEALAEGDQAGLSERLEAICEHHVQTARRGFRRNSETGTLCKPAVCFMLLARRAGLEVGVDPRFRAVRLDLRVQTLQEWGGRTVRGERIEAEFDIVPVDQLGQGTPAASRPTQ